MKIKKTTIPQMTIEEFAEKNGLEMEVHERERGLQDKDRFYAHFRHCEISEGSTLIGAYGDGVSPEMAISNYGNQISMKTIVIDAYTQDRKTIKVPRIIRKGK